MRGLVLILTGVVALSGVAHPINSSIAAKQLAVEDKVEPLPYDYALEYVWTDGNSASGFSFLDWQAVTPSDTIAEAEIASDGYDTTQGTSCLSWSSLGRFMSSTGIYLDGAWGHANYRAKKIIMTSGQKETVRVTSDAMYLSGIRYQYYVGSWDGNRTMHLLSYVNGRYAWNGKLYRFRSWDKNNPTKMIRDMIPCIKDGKVRLYDKVTKTFIAPFGTVYEGPRM